MRVIDVHAHIVPQVLWKTVQAGNEWFGYHLGRDAQGRPTLFERGQSGGPLVERLVWTAEQRIADMDALGVDVHVLSVAPWLFSYGMDPSQHILATRQINDEIADWVRGWPKRFAGLATLPLPDVKASVAELERAVKNGL